MEHSCLDAGNFLESLLKSAGLNLSFSLQEGGGQCLLDIAGPDADLLQADSGELLEALQHLLNQAFARKLPPGQRIVCDVHSFRATREAELRAMAQHAAERVRATGTAFTFSTMNANERRIIHLTLADSADLDTQSVGEGADRRLRVALKSLPK
jgi:spoIIIJ-associated protein